MERHLLLFFLFSTVAMTSAQHSDTSSLGVLITPPTAVQVSKELRAALPKNATVRLVNSTTLAPGGEQVLVYETGNKYEPHSHIAVVKDGKRVDDFALTKLFQRYGIGDTYALFQASEVRTVDDRRAFVAAFRNIGDGSGTLFVVLTERDGHYDAWKKATTQGRLKILRSGDVEIWEAGDVPDGEINCVWCSRYYQVQTLKWQNGRLTKTRQTITRNTLNPSAVAERPIVIEK